LSRDETEKNVQAFSISEAFPKGMYEKALESINKYGFKETFQKRCKKI